MEEVVQLRSAITDRKREETALLQQVAERRSRAEAVETENKAISSRNDLVSNVVYTTYLAPACRWKSGPVLYLSSSPPLFSLCGFIQSCIFYPNFEITSLSFKPSFTPDHIVATCSNLFLSNSFHPIVQIPIVILSIFAPLIGISNKSTLLHSLFHLGLIIRR